MSKKSKPQWTVSTFSEADDGGKSKPEKTTKSKNEPKSDFIPIKYKNNYEPQTRADLALTNIRTKPIEAWFTNLQSKKKGRILLLTGPIGSGKTAAVRVIAKERQFEIIDWVLPDIIDDPDDNSNAQGKGDVKALREFLLRAGRYPQIGSSSCKKLIIVEDIPDSIISHREDFYNILRDYAGSALVPLVIIYSHTDPNYLLNMDLKVNLKIETLLFKMVPETCIKKALNRVVLIHGLPTSKFTTVINIITTTCGGNIRKAISELQIYMFQSEKGKSDKVKLHALGQQKLYLTKMDKVLHETGIFHSVGRVLYAKRLAQTSEASTSKSNAPFLHDPMDIVEQYVHVQSQFVNLLHNNYLDIFSTMESIASASEYLSDSDIITAEWREKEGLAKIGFAVAVNGMMGSCHNPVRKWKPLSSSSWIQEKNSFAKSTEDVKETYSDLRCLGVEYNTDFLPMFNLICQKHGIPVRRCKFQFAAHEDSNLISRIHVWRNRGVPVCKTTLGIFDDDEKPIIEDYSD